ncbi:leucine-rich repeat serine/threonine-protein kinase 1-like isoform X2 [Amphiura filiformis]|uniref:leucine-rich repeat serine/threonine-protein kinase 1-like isoform X2 n=1 Tax=Amphiura filiformis TaxID=82378 RepID=UPI003B210C81
MEENIESAADQLLQYIQDPDNFSPEGFVQQLELLAPEVIQGLFSTDNANRRPERAKELLPAACERGDLEAVVWLLVMGADPSVIAQKGSSLEIATVHGHAEIVDKLISWNEGALESRDTVIGCLRKACEGHHRELIKFWLGHLNNLYLYKEPWSNFVRNNSPLPGYALRVPKHCIQQLSDAVIQVMGETVQHILEAWVDSDEEEVDEERLCAHWNSKNLPLFDETWLQRPRYNTHLVHIDLSQNAFKTIPEMLLWGIPWLEYLDLSDNLITELPDVGQTEPDQSGLIYLKVTSNKLTYISNDVFMMPQLQMLSLARNKITFIGLIEQEGDVQPEWKCTSLQELNLSFNELTCLPERLSVASRLKRLEVSNNHLEEMTKPWHCPMEILDLSHNAISEIPDVHVYWRQSLRILNLSSNNLRRIPHTICQLTMLENLDLSNTGIRRLPDKDTWKTFSLAKLDLSANHLVVRKAKMRKITRYYGFGSPSFTQYWEYIEPVELSFPDYFDKKLKALNLSYNDLHDVPDSVCQMRHLQYLDIQGNPCITCLPDQMAALRDLVNLKFGSIQIKHPSELAKLFCQPTERNVEDKTHLVKQTLRKRFLQYEVCREMKIIMVGPSQTGKTELLCSLTGIEWPQSDLGVNVVSKASLNFDKKVQDIQFTIWDLKGSDEYLVIHQAFLTPHTIYLLVWDMTKRDDESMEKLEPHVLNIKARAPLSPIIAVGTHIDRYKHNRQQIVTESIAAFSRKFQDTDFTFVEVDARPVSSEGIIDLKRMIYNHATTMTYMKGPHRYIMLGREVPRSFIHLKEQLSHAQENLPVQRQHAQDGVPVSPKPFLTEAELAAIIERMSGNFIETTKEVEQVVEYLQDCGTLIHIQDYTYKLTRLYFLDPVWLSNTLVKVVRLKNSDINEHQGIVTESQLRRLSVASGFGEHNFKEYLQLLARFEITLSTIKSCRESCSLNEPRKYIIPSALPYGRPWIETIGDNPYKHKLMRWYQMAYTPPGFWSRLVARLLVSIKQQDLNQFRIQLEHILPCVSQEGLFIRHDDGEIKIEPMQIFNDPSLRIILLSKDNLFSPLGFIVDHIEKLLKEWYPGLTKNRLDGRPRVIRYIPCPVCVQNFQNNTSDEEGHQQIPKTKDTTFLRWKS